MKHFLEIIIYPKKDELVQNEDGSLTGIIRYQIELPNVAAGDFNPQKHTGKVFAYPDPQPANPFPSIYIFKHARPESEEERGKLIELGKWHEACKVKY